MTLDYNRLHAKAKDGKTKPKIYTLDDRMDFGKYKGQLLFNVIENSPRGVKWYMENVPWFFLNDNARRKLEKELEDLENEMNTNRQDDYDDEPWF